MNARAQVCVCVCGSMWGARAGSPVMKIILSVYWLIEMTEPTRSGHLEEGEGSWWSNEHNSHISF